MKRLRPIDRKRIVTDHLMALSRDWLCRYGQWNQEKLLSELAAAIKRMRK